MVLLNDFSFLKINGFKKPKCWKDVDKPGPSAVIHDSGVGNKRPMCKLGVRVSNISIETGSVIDQTHISANENSRRSSAAASRATHFGI